MSFSGRTFCAVLLLVLIPYMALAGVVSVPFTSGTADMVTTPTGTVPTIPGFSTMTTPGNPQLPSMSTYVLLPPYADVKTIKVEIKNPVEQVLPDAYSIDPTPPLVYDKDGKQYKTWNGANVVDGKNVDIYGKDEFYPNNYATTSFSGKLNIYRLLPVTFWPYKYNPATGTVLHLISGEVVVSFNDLRTTQSVSGDAFSLGKLKDIAQNWQDASQWYKTTSLQSAATPLAIITTSAVVNGSSKFADFVDHKTAMGFSVTVATEADWGGGTGNTAAENIRTWLKANYLTKARYALLIGNPDPSVGDVPMKMFYFDPGDRMRTAPSDYYYADMNGNWDLNDNGYPGEEPGDFGEGGIDLIPEVIVGRIPFYNNDLSTFADLDKILQKMINYESSTEVGSWVQRMLIPMKPLDPTTPNWPLGEAIKNNVTIPSGLGFYRIYQENYGLASPPEMTPCETDKVVNEWKKGYGFVFWSTHGSSTEAASVFDTNYCQYLDDTKPAFTYHGSCENAYPEMTYNLAYSLLKNGAIGTVAATRVSYYFYAESNFENSDSIGGMGYKYSIYLANQRMACGDALYAMMTNVPRNIWANHLVMNLYGDPTIKPQWPTTPLNIETQSLPATTVGGSCLLNLVASGGSIPYTWSVESGSLPDGLWLSPMGIIAGTATKSGSYTFTAKVTDANGASATKTFTMKAKMNVAFFSMDTDPGWTCEGDWAFGVPTGQGTPWAWPRDPVSGFTGTNVYGNNLNGDYSDNMAETKHLTTTAIDCSKVVDTTLTFYSWLGVLNNDNANIEVSNDGVNWTEIYHNTDSQLASAWSPCTYDISAIADLQPTVYIRWGLGPTDGTYTAPGWNIDDVKIVGTLEKPLIEHNQTLKLTDVTTGSYEIIANVTTPNSLQPCNPGLFWSTGDGFIYTPMTLVSGNTYRGYIPAQHVGTKIKYYFYAEDQNYSSVLPCDAPENCFTIDVIVDTEPPVITHTPLPNTTDNVGPYKVYATVIDNIGVSTVKLISWKNGSTTQTTTTMMKTDKPNEWYAKINGPVAVGMYFNYKIVATDSSQSHNQTTSPQNGSYMFTIIPNSLTKIYNFPMDVDPGWSREGGWAFGIPTGQGTNNLDPTSGHTGSNIFGYNLDGDYPGQMAMPEYLTTTGLDFSNVSNATLKFWRWLGVENFYCDHATVGISSDGLDWTELWHNSTDQAMTETAWSQQTFDIASIADGKSNVFIRWGMGPTDYSLNFCGWNIDDVEIWGKIFQPAANMISAKSIPNNTVIVLRNKVVTACYPGYLYVADAKSRQGIRIAWPYPIAEGTPVTVYGMIKTRAGEREIAAENVVTEGSASLFKPVFVTCKNLGGTTTGLQPGVINYTYRSSAWKSAPAIGLNNIGMLVKVSGKVTQMSSASNYFYIDDGSGVKDGTSTGTTQNVGVRVSYPPTGLSAGQFVTITGISTGFLNTKSELLRQIMPRRDSDIIK